MLYIFIVIFAAVLIVSLLMFFVLRAKKGKETNVREYYAFKCISLLIVLAGDTIAIIAAPYSVWDFAADFLGFKETEPLIISIISKLLVFMVFMVCCTAVAITYKHWKGPLSRRQYNKDLSELSTDNILEDFFAACQALIRKEHIKEGQRHLLDTAEHQADYETGKLAWYMEFSKIYMLMVSQVKIDLENDWHAQQHCLISSYVESNKIAIFCSDNDPTENEINSFLEYIFQLNKKYFFIIVAIKESKERKKDYTKTYKNTIIKYIYKQNMLDSLVDFSNYYREINALYKKPLMGSDSLGIDDIYVEPYCRQEETGKNIKLESYVSNWLNKKENRQLALLGDFGQGKTLFSTYLTYQMIQRKERRIPVLISLRNKSPRNSTPAEIMSYFAIPYGLNPEALLILNANGRLLLIFDGFDEMDLVGNDDIRRRHFSSLWSLVTPESKILITGRPNYFIDRDEMKGALAFQPETTELPYCEGLFLLPFNQEQIMLALRSAKESVQEGIQRVMARNASPSFLDLISRPSHLFLVSQIWEERELEKKYANLTSASIINEFLQNNFERQSAKGRTNPYFYLSPIEREYFMIGLAAKMYKLGGTAVTYDFFQNTIMDLVDLFPDQLSKGNPAFLNLRNGRTVKEFAEQDKDSALAIINDVRTCGILVNDKSNNGLAFAHKSFFDLLVAKFYLGKYRKDYGNNLIIYNALSKVSAFNPRLGNDLVIRKLLAELISAQICVDLKTLRKRDQCKKIFEQCRKMIIRFPSHATPEKLLRTCIKNQSIKMYSNNKRKIREEMQTLHKRQLRILFGFILSMCAYIIKVISLSVKLGSEMVHLNVLSAEAEMAVSSPNFEINVLFYMVILAGIFIIVRTGMSPGNSPESKADIVLLTWYYACIENKIPENVIYRYFSKSYGNIFADYIKGKSMNQIQRKMNGNEEHVL